MPELPEVEALCRALRGRLRGRAIRSVRVVRPRTVAPLSARQFCRALVGARISGLERKGKYLLFRLTHSPGSGDERVLLVHLRMTGHLCLDAATVPLSPSASLVFDLDRGERLVFRDPRGLGLCQYLSRSAASARLAILGIEPLSREFTPARLLAITRGSRCPIKVFLMEQRRVAGLGNLYAAEALYRARMYPLLPAGALSRQHAVRLHRAIVGVLRDAVQSAVRGYQGPGQFQPHESFVPQVYRRAGLACPNCGGPIKRCLVRARSTFFCPRCQRL